MVENFTAHITPFGLDRNTFVYLPDDWQSSGRRYPVVYMFDGHNLFFDSTAKAASTSMQTTAPAGA